MLLADSPLAPEQKTPERGNSRLSVSAEAHQSLLHEPGSPGKHMQTLQDTLLWDLTNMLHGYRATSFCGRLPLYPCSSFNSPVCGATTLLDALSHLMFAFLSEPQKLAAILLLRHHPQSA